MSRKRTQNQQVNTTIVQESPLFQLHPHRMMLYFALGSITVLFFGLTAAYLFSEPNWHWSKFRFPKVFLISTVVLVGSSFTIHHSVKAYIADKSQRLQQLLFASFVLSLLFVGLQLWGWYSLYAQGIYLNGKPDGSYLYLISGLHAAHVLAGLLVLGYVYWKTRQQLRDPVSELLYYTNPSQKMKLEMIAIYWHFVDILWVYLLLFFLFNHL